MYFRYALERNTTMEGSLAGASERSVMRTGRIDSQRGLLNREALQLPKFLSLEKESDSGELPSRMRLRSFGDESDVFDAPTFDPTDGKLPTASQARVIFTPQKAVYKDTSLIQLRGSCI